MRARPTPPHPELVRRPSGAFGWLDARLLHEGWLGRLSPETIAVLVLLALAADRHGASFYGRERMGEKLGLSRTSIDHALGRLLELGLVAHRPWQPGLADGVWQLLPLPHRSRERRGEMQPIADVLRQLGMNR